MADPGPFYEDLSATVQGLTLFEAPGVEVGRTAMTQIVGDAQAILAAWAAEGEAMAFRVRLCAGNWCGCQKTTCRGAATTSPTISARPS